MKAHDTSGAGGPYQEVTTSGFGRNIGISCVARTANSIARDGVVFYPGGPCFDLPNFVVVLLLAKQTIGLDEFQLDCRAIHEQGPSFYYIW